MSKRLIPQVKKEVLDIVRAALNDEKSIDVIGLGSKRLWGRPNKTTELVDLSTLSDVTLYETARISLDGKCRHTN